jgi:hypothetical protein
LAHSQSADLGDPAVANIFARITFEVEAETTELFEGKLFLQTCYREIRFAKEVEFCVEYAYAREEYKTLAAYLLCCKEMMIYEGEYIFAYQRGEMTEDGINACTLAARIVLIALAAVYRARRGELDLAKIGGGFIYDESSHQLEIIIPDSVWLLIAA